MGTLNAIYVRAAYAQLARTIVSEFPTAVTEAESEFFAIDQAPNCFRCPDEMLASLSSRLQTDVIWLSFQSVVDAFQFFHWQEGARIRVLVYGCEQERTWERVEGTPEPWESAALFDQAYLEDMVECSETDAQRHDIIRIYHERLIAPGSFEPSVEAREAARAAASFYRLPGWS